MNKEIGLVSRRREIVARVISSQISARLFSFSLESFFRPLQVLVLFFPFIKNKLYLISCINVVTCILCVCILYLFHDYSIRGLVWRG